MLKMKISKHLDNIKPYMTYVLFAIFLLLFRMLEGRIRVNLFDAVVYTSIYAIAGFGFALLLGYGGLASLGTGAFVGIGIFGLHYFYKYVGLNLLIVIAIVLLLSIIVSIIFGFVSLRISGLYLAIVTLGLSQIVIEIIKNISYYASGSTPGFLIRPARPLQLFGRAITTQNSIIFIAIFLLVCMIVVKNLMESPTGRALLSIKNSPTAAQTMGIDVVKYRLLAFLVSGIYGTIAGVLSMLYKKTGNTNAIDLTFALNILAAVVIGGTKSIWGIFLGTFIVFGLNLAFLDAIGLGSYSIVVSGILIILILMFYPGGLIQIFGDIKIKVKKLRVRWREKYYGEE